jgi:hypothetical protein
VDPGQYNFYNFPPLLVFAGTNEILVDDSKLFYEKIKLSQLDTGKEILRDCSFKRGS